MGDRQKVFEYRFKLKGLDEFTEKGLQNRFY